MIVTIYLIDGVEIEIEIEEADVRSVIGRLDLIARQTLEMPDTIYKFDYGNSEHVCFIGNKFIAYTVTENTEL